MVGMEAKKNGIGNGAGGTSVLGDLTGLGVGLGAMNEVIKKTKDALSASEEHGEHTSCDKKRTE